jgi:hypothetical protein
MKRRRVGAPRIAEPGLDRSCHFVFACRESEGEG